MTNDSEESDLRAFFSAKSIAVVGASDVKGKVGYDVVNGLVSAKYPGIIYPINIKKNEIQGLKAYKTLSNAPEIAELVVVAVPSKFVLSVIDEMGKLGMKSVIIITAGFKEIGAEGLKLEKELETKLKEYGIRAIGPNCLGLLDTH
ncbi:MAG: CoA-binding protein, partial [Candidatus Hodarchaeales archaeon]